MTTVRESALTRVLHRDLIQGASLAHCPMNPRQIRDLVAFIVPRLVRALEDVAYAQYVGHMVGINEEPLTKRQYQILEYMVWGYSSQEMARFMNLAESSVKTHRRRLYQRLGVTGGSTDAVVQAHVRGHIDIGKIDAMRPQKVKESS